MQQDTLIFTISLFLKYGFLILISYIPILAFAPRALHPPHTHTLPPYVSLSPMHRVHQPVLFCFLCGHEEVTVDVFCYFVYFLPCCVGKECVEAVAP